MTQRFRFRSLALRSVFAALATSACHPGNTGPADELAVARERWGRAGLPSYTMTVARSCECVPETSGPVRVVVRNRRVESRQYVESGAAVPERYADLFPGVEGLFAVIDQAMRTNTRPFAAYYDAVLGYPTRIELGDPAVDAPVYSVTELRP